MNDPLSPCDVIKITHVNREYYYVLFTSKVFQLMLTYILSSMKTKFINEVYQFSSIVIFYQKLQSKMFKSFCSNKMIRFLFGRHCMLSSSYAMFKKVLTNPSSKNSLNFFILVITILKNFFCKNFFIPLVSPNEYSKCFPLIMLNNF